METQLYLHQRAIVIYRWKWFYYQGDPEVDDQTFDLHWRNLIYLEEKYPHWVTYDSPLESVGTGKYTSLAQIMQDYDRVMRKGELLG